MNPQEFVKRWREVELKERSASQSHFSDLCRLLGVSEPVHEDHTGETYCFEKGMKTADGDGWADVWKRGCFAWEYKGKRANLEAALKQLQTYALGLENPPLLIVSDMDRIRVHTAFTGLVSSTHEFSLDDLLDADKRDFLAAAFSPNGVDRFKPQQTRQNLTETAAKEFAALAQRLRDRGHPADAVAHFVNRLVFCMFAEDVRLLPDYLFSEMIKVSLAEPDNFAALAGELFAAMSKGGRAGWKTIDWFNGGLFNDEAALPLEKGDLKNLQAAAQLDWSGIDPSIFGTLFERGLDPAKRGQLGAHYTDREKIMMIVEPVIIRPLLAEWKNIYQQIIEKLALAKKQKGGAPTQRRKEANELHAQFLERLKAYRILDPACGSGNFLYLALLALKDIEHRANLDVEALGLQRGFPVTGPENVLGIEINEYAADLARMSVWIGEIQWMRRNGFDAARNPVLRPLEHIQCHDALLNEDGSEFEWPEADAIIGNPPFLGGKLLRSSLGDDYVGYLFGTYEDRVSAEADYVVYWVAKAWEKIEAGASRLAGLVTTNSIRGGANRSAVDPIADDGALFDVWSDEEWTVEGAAVRVSILCFGDHTGDKRVDGAIANRINADLSGSATNLTKSARLRENAGIGFMGDTKGGAFDVPGAIARQWLQSPLNPNGRPNSDVLKPWINGLDLTRRPRDMWIIDFGWQMNEATAALYEGPFAYIEASVKPIRTDVLRQKREAYRNNWWRHVEPRPGMWSALAKVSRFLTTTTVSKHRVFGWFTAPTCPDHQLIVLARDDDTFFGILQSHLHEIWSLLLGTSLEDRPRYTPTTTFETFPFPEGLTPNLPADSYKNDPRARAIADAAKDLNAKREAWLNPPDLVDRVPEVVPGYPDMLIPKSDAAAAELRRRTLTNLYNARPTWLDMAHKKLDAAVADAYGWPSDLSDEEILKRLFDLNQERSNSGR